jgi:di/tricarboxylate transporter
VPLSELYDRIEWPVVVLLGSMIPLGAALETSGGTALIAGAREPDRGMARLGDPDGPDGGDDDPVGHPQQHGHAIVAAPVAITMADRLSVSPDPFLMAVAVAASAPS